MKVLHLLQSPHFSGAENVVCQIIGMFRDDPDFEMAYCSQDGQIREALAERNITFYPMTKLTCAEVRRVIKAYQPDVIHAHDMHASFVGALSCGQIPLISHIHNNSYQSRGLSVKSIAYILAGMKAKHIFWVSQSSLEGYAFKKLFRKKSSVLMNIIDIDALYEKMRSDPAQYSYDIVYVGRLTYPKHPERLIDVLEKVCEKQPDVKIAIIGTGDLEETTKTLCHEKGLDSNIAFLGFCSNPLKIMHDAKAMVMTSRWEGTPMCALEAQSLGLPIVTTPADGLCDLLIEGETGFLSEDDVILADRLCQIVCDRGLYEKMHNNSKNSMRKRMDKQSYAAAMRKIYRQ